jgi:hypothetical protein
VLAPEGICSAKYICAAEIRGSGTRLVKAQSVPIALEVVEEYAVKLGTCGVLCKALTKVGLSRFKPILEMFLAFFFEEQDYTFYSQDLLYGHRYTSQQSFQCQLKL